MLELKNSSLSKWFYWEPFYTYFFEKFKDHAFRFFCRKWLIYFPNSDENTFIFEQCRKHFISVSVFILIYIWRVKKNIYLTGFWMPLLLRLYFSLYSVKILKPYTTGYLVTWQTLWFDLKNTTLWEITRSKIEYKNWNF